MQDDKLYPSLGSSDNGSDDSARLALSSAFKFGGFETINDKVLKEMNERAKRNAFNTGSMTPQSFRSRNKTGASGASGTPGRSQAAIMASSARSPTSRRTHKRYSSIHRRNFAKMESIASHYSVQAHLGDTGNGNSRDNELDDSKSGDKRAGDDAVVAASASPKKKRRTEEFGPPLLPLEPESQSGGPSGSGGSRSRRGPARASGSTTTESAPSSLPSRGARAAPRTLSSIPSIGNLRAHVAADTAKPPAPLSQIPQSPSMRNLRASSQAMSSATGRASVNAIAIHTDPEPDRSPAATKPSMRTRLGRPIASLRRRTGASTPTVSAPTPTGESHHQHARDHPTNNKENGQARAPPAAAPTLRASASSRSLRQVSRVEAVLNRLPQPPQSNTSPEKTESMLSALPKPPVPPATAAESRIPRSSSVARSLAASGDNNPHAHTPRLARSRLVARSSPNLKTLAARQDATHAPRRPSWR